MNLKTRPVFRLFSLCLILTLFSIMLLPVHSFAANNMFEGEVELTGDFYGRFTLNSSDMKLFNLENIVPGDTWKGKIHVKNTTYEKMEISIISIVSNLQDNTLFDALDLKIMLDSDEIYNGSYGATGEPISDYYEIQSKQKITFDLVVSLPKTAGNNVQNKKMDSTWTFEARYYGKESVGGGGQPSSTVNYTVYYVDEDGNELLEKKTSYGYAGSKITETAPSIESYTPDAKQKTIYLRKPGENKIVFVYSLNKTKPIDPTDPIEPSDPTKPTEPSIPGSSDPTTPPDDTKPNDDPTIPGETNKPSDDSSVKTGVDMTDSNSMVATWLFIFGLCLIGGAILFLRIRAEQKRIETSKTYSKEVKANVEK